MLVLRTGLNLWTSCQPIAVSVSVSLSRAAGCPLDHL